MSNRNDESALLCPLCAQQGQTEYKGLTDRMSPGSSQWSLNRCGSAVCGILWLSPRPDDAQLEAAYAHYYTHAPATDAAVSARRRLIHYINQQYLKFRFGYSPTQNRGTSLVGLLMYLFPDKRAKLDLSVFWQRHKPSGTFVELGFGSGSSLLRLDQLGWTVKGCEYDTVAVRNAQDAGLDVYHGELVDWSLTENSVDTIGMSHVIEHVKRPADLIKECYRILKPGGQLVMVTPNIHSIGHRFFKDSWLNLDPPRHLHLFDLTSLSRLTQAAGFSNKRLTTSTRDASRLFLASRKIRHSGGFDMGARYSWPERVFGLGYASLTTFANKIHGKCGEELVVICIKPGNPEAN